VKILIEEELKLEVIAWEIYSEIFVYFWVCSNRGFVIFAIISCTKE